MPRGFLECFWIALKLGFISFGGPVAHIGYFREVYVTRLKWLDERRFAELMTLTQFLPGPGSSQLGAAIGYERGGWLGGFGSWLGFTLPSTVAMIAFAVGMGGMQQWLGDGWLHGLKLAAVAVVAVAFLGMRKGLCPRLPETLLAGLALVILLFAPLNWVPPVIILLGSLAGVMMFSKEQRAKLTDSPQKVDSRKSSWFVSILPTTLIMAALIITPLFFSENKDVAGLGGLLQAGALVFGGGHVVLPLLESSTVDSGLLSDDTFLAGYGTAQALPGPLFTFGGFLGAAMRLFGNAWLGGAIGIMALFLPGMVLLAGALPIWNKLKYFAWVRAGVRGANATVVGVLGAALVGMLTSGSLSGILDGIGILVLALAIYFKLLPVWTIVAIAAVAGGFLW